MTTSTQSNSNTKPKSARLSSTSESKKNRTIAYANLNFKINRIGKSKFYTRKETPVTYATINPETTIYETINSPKPPPYDRIDNRRTSNITAVNPASNTPKQQQNVRPPFDIPNVEKKKFPGFSVRKLFGTRKQKRDTPKPANQESAKLPWWKKMFGKEKKTKKVQQQPISVDPISNSKPVSDIPTESQTSRSVSSKNENARSVFAATTNTGLYATVKKLVPPPLPERKYRKNINQDGVPVNFKSIHEQLPNPKPPVQRNSNHLQFENAKKNKQPIPPPSTGPHPNNVHIDHESRKTNVSESTKLFMKKKSSSVKGQNSHEKSKKSGVAGRIAFYEQFGQRGTKK